MSMEAVLSFVSGISFGLIIGILAGRHSQRKEWEAGVTEPEEAPNGRP